MNNIFDIPADLDTPTSVYLKLAPLGPRFLLESVEQGDQVGRFSFIGFGPGLDVRSDGRSIQAGTTRIETDGSMQGLMDGLRKVLVEAPAPGPISTSIPFHGGLVGAIGFDVAHRLVGLAPPPSSRAEIQLYGPPSVIVFDHLSRRAALLHDGPDSDRLSLRREVISLLSSGLPGPNRTGGFERADGGWVVPPWRDSDVQREADLIEEVARIHGLDKLPTTLPARRSAVGRLTESQRLRRRLEDLLRDRGLDECISYSFISAHAIDRLRLGDEEGVLALQNPLSEDQSLMRPLLLPGLLDAARHNSAHGRAELALFESAHVYRWSRPLEAAPAGSPAGTAPADERHHLAVLQTQAARGSWRSEPRAADFFSARAALEAVLEVAQVDWSAEPEAQPFLHPGRSAAVIAEPKSSP